MKKVLSGGLIGLFFGGAVMLFFSWVEGIISFRFVPLRIESFEFTPQVALMLFQCLLTGVIAGGGAYYSGRWGLAVVVSIVVGYGLGFFFVEQNDQPWGTIGALAMLPPLVFAGVLSSLTCAIMRRQEIISAKTKALS